MPSVGGPTQSQRSQELRKFFAPSSGTNAPNSGFNTYIEDDRALASFAETLAWRLGAKRTMISLIDGETQYFLAGAELDGKNMEGRVDWFGCSNIPISQSLCQYTIAADDSTSAYPCLVIEDLLEDERFCHLPVVNGTVAAYRFYAGTSIATSRGVKIGSFFLLDNKPRPGGLTLEQRKVMCTSAASVMKHLEMQREAAERRRVSLMSHGIARFLEGKSAKDDDGRSDQEHKAGASAEAEHILNEKEPAPADSGRSSRRSSTETEDPVQRTLESAASILRESLEIESGGVMFLDTAVSFDEPGYTDAYSDPNTLVGQNMEAADGKDDRPVFRHNREQSHEGRSSSDTHPYNGPIRSSENRNRAAEIMAISMSTEYEPNQPADKVLDSKTLQTLLNVYPEGNIWYFDEGGRSIVQQLGGIIAVRSLQGRGTEVEICIPVEKPNQSDGSHNPDLSLGDSEDAEGSLEALRNVGSKTTIALQRPPSLREGPLNGQEMILGLVENYVSDWYGFTVSIFTDWVVMPKADIVIALEAYEPFTTSALPRSSNRYIPTLLLNGTLASKGHKWNSAGINVGHVTSPVGPYKLARHLLSIIRSQEVTGIPNPAERVPLAANGNDPLPKNHLKNLPVASHPRQPNSNLVQRLGHLDTRDANPTSAPLEAARKPSLRSGLRILAVDDNEINLQLLQRFLSKRKDDTVDCARDGFEAVAAVQNAARPFDVIFMDISMPGMDGFEATRKIRQYENDRVVDNNSSDDAQPIEEMRKDSRCYIVALTGLGASRDREEATKCGFDEYMTKPIPFQKVGKSLKERSSNMIG